MLISTTDVYALMSSFFTRFNGYTNVQCGYHVLERSQLQASTQKMLRQLPWASCQSRLGPTRPSLPRPSSQHESDDNKDRNRNDDHDSFLTLDENFPKQPDLFAGFGMPVVPSTFQNGSNEDADKTERLAQYAVLSVAKYSAASTQSHWNAAKRILRYLKRTKNFVLCYYQTDEQVIGYSAADFAHNVDGRHSVSSYVCLLRSGAISWYSGKQKHVSTSNTQAEYIALSHVTKEAIFLRQLFSEFNDSDYGATCINEDNQAAIAIARNPAFYSKVKHIDLSYHFTREAVTNGNIQLKYCSTNDMYADILTTPLTSKHFDGMLVKFRLSFVKAKRENLLLLLWT